MNRLIKFYSESLEFNNYYSTIKSNVVNHPMEHVESARFLCGIQTAENLAQEKNINTVNGDLRIDAPVWFGDVNIANIRIIVLGLEPRDTDSTFNIEKVGNKVFGSPFGVDRWNKNSSVKRKPQNRYYRVFSKIIEKEDVFIVFSDVVKFYKIINSNNDNRINDNYARENFFIHANSERENLIKELQIINPTHIITLGRDAFLTVKKILPNNDNIYQLRHPAQGGEKIAAEQLNQLLSNSL